MSDDDAVASFVLDYELSAQDLSEWIAAEPSVARRRRSHAVLMTLLLVLACAGTITWLVLRHQLLACVATEPGSRYAVPQIWLWHCQAGSPSALLDNDAELVAAVVVLWSLGISYAAKFWRAAPTRQAADMMAQPGAAGSYRAETGRGGITTLSPDGLTTYLPWSAVSSVRETDQLFLLFGIAAQARMMLPKRGLRDPDALPRLREFLTDSAAGSGQSSSPPDAQ